jgi:hypothetical protein
MRQGNVEIRYLVFVVLPLPLYLPLSVANASIPFTGVFVSDGVSVRDAALDEEGNMYVTGWTVDPNSSGNYGTIKYDKDGKKIWSKWYDGPQKGFDCAEAVALDRQGNVYVSGSIQLTPKRHGTFNAGYATIKYDAHGNELWTALYEEPAKHKDSALLAVDNNGNSIVAGRCKKEDSSFNYDFLTIMYDTKGKQLWTAIYDGPGYSVDMPSDLTADNYGNVYVAGCSMGKDHDYDFAVAKYNESGDTLWVARYEEEGKKCSPDALVVDDSGNVYVTGDCTDWKTYAYIVTIKYDNKGGQLWSKTYRKPNELIYSGDIATDGAGNIYVYGSTNDGPVLIQYDAGGKQKWATLHQEKAYLSSGTLGQMFSDIQDDIYLTAFVTAETPTWTSCLIIKYDLHGNKKWSKTFDSIQDLAHILSTGDNGD